MPAINCVDASTRMSNQESTSVRDDKSRPNLSHDVLCVLFVERAAQIDDQTPRLQSETEIKHTTMGDDDAHPRSMIASNSSPPSTSSMTRSTCFCFSKIKKNEGKRMAMSVVRRDGDAESVRVRCRQQTERREQVNQGSETTQTTSDAAPVRQCSSDAASS